LKSRNSHPESLKTAMEAAIAAVDLRQPIFDVKTMEVRVFAKNRYQFDL
jgi:mRNA-degrading endonuclease HigB of HigAB toxin-antitoxin module